MLDINPKEKHGSAMAIWGAGIMIGPIIGPTLGGYLTEMYNWRWVFFINLPLGILTILGVSIYMPSSQSQQRRFNWIGFLGLAAIVIGCIQLVLDRGEQAGWFNSFEVPIYFLVAASAIWMYIGIPFKPKTQFYRRPCFWIETTSPVLSLCFLLD